MNFKKSIFKAAAVLMAALAFMLVSCESPVAETILKVSVKSPSVAASSGQQFVKVQCSGKWSLSLTTLDGSSASWASFNVTSGHGDRNDIIISYQENTESEERSVMLNLTSGSRNVSCSLTQAGAGQLPGPGTEPGPAPGPDPDPDTPSQVKTGWLELPSMESKDLEYYSHSFEMNGKKYRNYTFGWSQKDLVALWIAYPLCQTYTNKRVERTDKWAYDPILGEEKSSAPFGGYGGDYARGHQVPSADRLCSYEANIQTFYGTNITPQLNAHNEGVWQNLETRVRNWANSSDTTYVVTGCVVKGSKEITKDSDRKNITVPVAYYKALVRYHKASTIAQWAGAAFYLEHRDYKGTERNITKDHPCVMSIDELEEITGVDFFVNLPAKLGTEIAAGIESQDPSVSNVWW